jgi:hypothetical protein
VCARGSGCQDVRGRSEVQLSQAEADTKPLSQTQDSTPKYRAPELKRLACGIGVRRYMRVERVQCGCGVWLAGESIKSLSQIQDSDARGTRESRLNARVRAASALKAHAVEVARWGVWLGRRVDSRFSQIQDRLGHRADREPQTPGARAARVEGHMRVERYALARGA